MHALLKYQQRSHEVLFYVHPVYHDTSWAANAKTKHWAYVIWIGLLGYWKATAKDRFFTLLIFTTEFKEVSYSYIELYWPSEIDCTASSAVSRFFPNFLIRCIGVTWPRHAVCSAYIEHILCCKLLLWSIAISVLSAVFSRHTKKSS